jgi:prefoldin beta subunit
MEKTIQKETQEKINQLQMVEETLQQHAMSRQTFHSQILEIDSSLEQLTNKKTAYKIVGAIMIEKTKDELEAELLERKKTIEIRVSSIEKQEEKVKFKFESLQKEIMQELQGSGNRE